MDHVLYSPMDITSAEKIRIVGKGKKLNMYHSPTFFLNNMFDDK